MFVKRGKNSRFHQTLVKKRKIGKRGGGVVGSGENRGPHGGAKKKSGKLPIGDGHTEEGRANA